MEENQMLDVTTGGLSVEGVEALKDVLSKGPEESLQLWKTLPAPPFTELDGEYEPHFLPGHNEIYKAWIAAGLTNENSPRGYWLGKAYKPLGQVTGEGYNVWRVPGGRIERRVRYGTHIGTSRVDGRLALVMTYASFNRTAHERGVGASWQVDVVDEMRKVADGVLLGLATFKLGALLDPLRSGMRELHESYGLKLEAQYGPLDRTPPVATIFVLSGPVRPWVGVDNLSAEDI
jgi:hypothetical protein